MGNANGGEHSICRRGPSGTPSSFIHRALAYNQLLVVRRISASVKGGVGHTNRSTKKRWLTNRFDY
jgi:hypothetical protein